MSLRWLDYLRIPDRALARAMKSPDFGYGYAILAGLGLQVCLRFRRKSARVRFGTAGTAQVRAKGVWLRGNFVLLINRWIVSDHL